MSDGPQEVIPGRSSTPVMQRPGYGADHTREPTPELSIHDALLAASRAYRLSHLDLTIDGVKFDLTLYPWLVELLDTDHPNITIRKGAQLGFTVCMVLKSVDNLLYRYERSLLYLMPTRDDVSDFSKSRFDRMLKDNHDALGRYVKDVDAAGIKRIGNSFVYFRGSRSRSQLKSIPCDGVVFDEADEMEDAQIALALTRMDGSRLRHGDVIGERTDLSTPTLPDYGVDANYKRSDQRTFHIRCEHCGTWNCLESEWPNCLVRRDDGSVFRACRKCKKEVHPYGTCSCKREWVPAFPEKSKEHRGYWISQLCSPTVPPRVILDEHEDARTDIREFNNSRLGLAYADLEDMLDEPTLKAVCGPDPHRMSAQGPCFMGVDVGTKDFHYFIGERKNERHLEIVRWGTAHDANELHDLQARYNVMVGVIDAMAETRAVREFVSAHGGWYGCHYSEQQKQGYDWNAAGGTVKVNRTEALDHAHRVVIHKNVTFPRQDDRWADWVYQMTNLARVTKRASETGIPKVSWIIRGGTKRDHYRHAFTYAVLAAEMTPIAEKSRRIVRASEYERHGGNGRSFMAS